MQEVYLDLYFLVNVSMDLLCLLITAALLHRAVKRWRVLAAALFGGAYAAAALLLSFGGVVGFLFDIGAALLMCVIAFFGRGASFWRLLWQCTPVQMLVSMLLGGVMTALYSWLNRLNLPLEALQGDGLSVWTFALLTAVASFATLRGGRFLGHSQKQKRLSVRVTLFGKSVALSALVDSGNLLRDPISGKSVIVAELSRLSPLLPSELCLGYQNNDLADRLDGAPWAGRVRPIPARTATGEQLLFALVPDAVELCNGKECYPAAYLIAPAPLGMIAEGFDAVIALE